jgi:serine/threonine protein kinase
MPILVKSTDSYIKGPGSPPPKNLELTVLQAVCGHPNIVMLYGGIDDLVTNKIHLVMELLTPSYGGEFMPNLESSEFRTRNGLGLDMIFGCMATGIARGLVALHDAGFAHNDIALKNTAFTKKRDRVVFKLIDFNMSKRLRKSNYAASIDADNERFRSMIFHWIELKYETGPRLTEFPVEDVTTYAIVPENECIRFVSDW